MIIVEALLINYLNQNRDFVKGVVPELITFFVRLNFYQTIRVNTANLQKLGDIELYTDVLELFFLYKNLYRRKNFIK